MLGAPKNTQSCLFLEHDVQSTGLEESNISPSKEGTYAHIKVKYLEQDWCADFLASESVSMSVRYMYAACFPS